MNISYCLRCFLSNTGQKNKRSLENNNICCMLKSKSRKFTKSMIKTDKSYRISRSSYEDVIIMYNKNNLFTYVRHCVCRIYFSRFYLLELASIKIYIAFCLHNKTLSLHPNMCYEYFSFEIEIIS